MFRLSRRHRAPLVALALAATPLLAPAGANAALAGGPTLNSTVTPDLISAAVTNVTPSGTTVNFCFNKALGSTPVFGSFFVQNYRNLRVAANNAVTNGSCASATFNAVLDPQAFTTASVNAGAVTSAAAGAPTGNNNADSTALIQASGTTASNNGTRGRTTAPDLTGVTVSGVNVTYTFDEALAASDGSNSINPANFRMRNNLGAITVVGGGTPNISADRKSVTVQMTGGVPAVTSAVRAEYVIAAAPFIVSLGSQGTPTPDITWWSGVGTPGNGQGNTNLSDAIGANLVDGGNTATIDLVFDQPTDAATANAAGILIVMSDSTLRGTNLAPAPQTNANTVRFVSATPGTDNTAGEYIVGVTVVGSAAVTSAFVPAGGNAGAFATGYSTGPDARKATIDTTAGSATVTLDQRYSSAIAAGFLRVDNTGTVNTNPPSSLSFGDTTTPKETTITANYGSVGGVAGTRGIQILPGAMTTSLVAQPGDVAFFASRNQNLLQIIGIT